MALAAHQAGHFLLFGGPDGPVEERGGNGLVGHRLDALVLEVHRYGPEDDVHRCDDAEDVLGQVNDGFFAASARGAPIEGYFRFGGGIHRRGSGGILLHELHGCMVTWLQLIGGEKRLPAKHAKRRENELWDIICDSSCNPCLLLASFRVFSGQSPLPIGLWHSSD